MCKNNEPGATVIAKIKSINPDLKEFEIYWQR